ncbi:MAG: DUF3179 domain-containing protein [Acidobacteria bacterium]|nr:DUF3179 domain-containing protein [Acidobacteriota bacterium]
MTAQKMGLFVLAVVGAVVFVAAMVFVRKSPTTNTDSSASAYIPQRVHREAEDKSGVDLYPRGEKGFSLNVNPEIIPANEAPIEDGELVIGLAINGETRAYPVNYMMGPENEVVNDILGSQAIASTW